MQLDPLTFPRHPPVEIKQVRDSVAFDPARHLALTFPEKVWTLEDFGYDSASRAQTPSPVIMTSPFRILSDEGVAAFRRAVEGMKEDRTISTGSRLASYIRGSAYRSRYVRELCLSPEVATHLSAIAGTPLAPHTLPQMMAYINLAPDDPSRGVDNWHVDSIGFDTVMLASDPRQLKGGRFQYFKGTREEAAALVGADPRDLTQGYSQELPADRVVSAEYPAAGWALFMQGSYVFHRGTKLEAPGERTTLVAGYVARDVRFPDPTNTKGMQHWGSGDLLTEVARHAAWMAEGKLRALIEDLPFGHDRLALAEKLEAAVADALRIAAEMREGAAAKKG